MERVQRERLQALIAKGLDKITWDEAVELKGLLKRYSQQLTATMRAW